MKPERQRLKIAEACRWHDVQTNPLTKGERSPQLAGRRCPTGPLQGIPDYLNDLNAMHEAEKVLTKQQWEDYGDYLERMIDPIKGWLHSTASQRAEAFLRTLGLWEGSE